MQTNIIKSMCQKVVDSVETIYGKSGELLFRKCKDSGEENNEDSTMFYVLLALIIFYLY